jgi:hypothetical protein
MGTESQGSSQPVPSATAGDGNAGPLSGMPASIAPSELAEHLDQGWGSDQDADPLTPPESSPKPMSSAELALAPLPTFETSRTQGKAATGAAARSEAATKASSAVVKASLAARAVKARKAAASNVNPASTRGLYALPRASAAPTMATAPTQAPTASDAEDPLGRADATLMPASIPPPAEDENAWDVPSTSLPAAVTPASSVAPIAASSPTVPPSSRRSTSPRALLKPALTAAGSVRPSADDHRSTKPTFVVRGGTGEKQPQGHGNVQTAPKSALGSEIPAVSTTLAPAPMHAVTSEIRAAPTTSSPTPTIDITIEPSFPQTAVDSDLTLAGAAPTTAESPAAAAAIPTAPLTDRRLYLRLVEPSSSTTPLTASKPRLPGRSTAWLLGTALLAVAVIGWRLLSANDTAEPNIRRGQFGLVGAVPVQRSQGAVVTPPKVQSVPEPTATPTAAEPPPTAAEPPPTGAPAADLPTPGVPSAANPNEKKQRKRRVTASAAAAISENPAPQTRSESPTAPIPALAPGQSSPSLNAPISPTGGVFDPRAFPSNGAFPGNDGAGTATVTKVRVEVDPPDSRVAVQGKLAVAPYVFDVPRGSRIVLEVGRVGYITRRIVLDGSRGYVKVAMIPEPKTQETTETPPVSGATLPDQ